MQYSKWTKIVARFVVGTGASFVVGQAINAHVPAPDTKIQKVLFLTGKWGLAGVASEASKKYTDTVVDDLLETLAELKAEAKATKAQLDEIDQETQS